MGDGYDHLDLALAALGQELTTSVLEGGTHFCGTVVEPYAINGTTYAWKRGSRLKIGLDFDGLGVLTAAQVKESIEAAVNEVRATTDGLTFELFTPPMHSNIVVKLARLDGPSGVLADCGIPPPNASPDNTQLNMRIDTGEAWRLFVDQVQGAIDFQRVWLHEFLHGVGLGHKPSSIREPALIAPTYNPLIRGLQEADKGEIVRRYGGKSSPVPPPSVPGQPARAVKGTISVNIDGQTWQASGPLKLQAPQGLYQAGYPVQQIVIPIEQPEDLGVPEKWQDKELS
jgi:hypothetical protein